VRRLWEWWKPVARRIGNFQARVFLIFFYVFIFSPFALAVRWGSDPLAIKLGTPQGWRAREDTGGSPLERATRQF
jgi:hypothetical protein